MVAPTLNYKFSADFVRTREGLLYRTSLNFMTVRGLAFPDAADDGGLVFTRAVTIGKSQLTDMVSDTLVAHEWNMDVLISVDEVLNFKVTGVRPLRVEYGELDAGDNSFWLESLVCSYDYLQLGSDVD